ncbi:TIGR02302 family protein [Oryzibacter oryziterrae]|uniref:TIGR02302 family protein n=1 Tax=Oryzibacter oryziterrae TaxID=2766474 RepID=UPI001F262D2A|nr:TIGR02302 family protein [Oryzibacter oryziterrae]
MAAPGKPQTTVPDPLDAVAGQVRLARFALAWERLWPRLALALNIGVLLLVLSWTGFLDRLPDLVRLGVVGIMALALIAALGSALLVRLPTRREALQRLERDSGLAHHPLTTLVDQPAIGDRDPVGRALWQAHRRRVMAEAAGARAAAPSPRLDKADPYALRALVFLLAIIGWLATPDHVDPLRSAFRLPESPRPDLRMDAWVAPPAYTGAAPRYLPTDQTADAAPIRVPAGSLLTLRLNGVSDVAATYAGASGTEGKDVAVSQVAPKSVPAPDTHEPTAFEWPLEASGTLTVTSGESVLTRYRFDVVPDKPPVIRLTEEPGATAKGALHLAYEALDDYRVASAVAHFAPEGVSANARPLATLSDLPLTTPAKGAPTPAASLTRDFAANPLAGSLVKLTLEAVDEAGQHGTSPPLLMRLPQRTFHNPLAAMLVEQRRRLAADANQALDVASSIETASDLGADYIGRAAPIIGMRVVIERIRYARSDDDLRSAMDLLWSMALAIEAGDTSDAEQHLRDARNALRDAIERGASKEEIARLMDEVRKALDDYMQAMAEQLRNNPDRMRELAQRKPNPSQVMKPEDLDKLLKRLQELSELGQKDAAQQLLSQLDDLIDNMQMMPSDQAQGQQGGEDKALDALANMIRRQQELMNKTHKFTPEGRTDETTNMDGNQQQQALGDLQSQQQQLEKQLQDLLGQMQQQGRDGRDQLGEAGKSMRGAGEQLGQGDPETALERQGQALDAMRKGAQQMAQGSEGDGTGQGKGTRKPGDSQAEATDPLGRPQRRTGPDFGDTTSVPGEIEVQRARKLLDELRRRYSDPNRSPLELDYLKRLLGTF